ncbi:galactosamine 6-phosphate isomerase AgaS [Hephaestia caeni]|uniref:Galactosamine 6-phosphate isomerase AgaS n=1 Tax=Hephaestia caeni TaxID=645617 RepID=A0A397NTY6_9SPHN|nr:SIS domain-containing protein [Hephaestia caeni]RIA37174.1 galactosamine 6-phosphate isomerase AgaS [Hephaestia caeni]
MSDVLPPRADAAECWTRREIFQQPQTLRDTQRLLSDQAAAIERFISPLLARPNVRIVLTGAGTSAFVGQCLAPWLARETGRRVDAVATTDIVSAPDLYCERDTPTLLVSFGRSGNSPESVAAVDIANTRIARVHHLVITCNAEGALARNAGADSYVVTLPDAVNDRAFAMTSSFSSMMFAALSILSGIGKLDARVAAIADAVGGILADGEAQMAALAAQRFARVVYLGSGLFEGLAREAALKLLELTDGGIVTFFDTPMGFRHGPKTVVNKDTLIVVFVSNDPYTARYDRDLIAELRRDRVAGAIVTIAAHAQADDTLAIRHLDKVDDADLLFPYIVPAQLFALHASLALGMTPDTPNLAGTVNRVVRGVRIHPLKA